MMLQMDVKIYEQHRKWGKLPGYEADVQRSGKRYSRVPVFVIPEAELDMAVRLEEVDVIRQNSRLPLLILTDQRRVLTVSPEGYFYARYVGVIDADTARNILHLVQGGA